MDTKGFVVPPGGGSVLNMAPGRSAALKLLGGETGDSIMLCSRKPHRSAPIRRSTFITTATSGLRAEGRDHL